ncbi:hypothetical protein RJ639_000592 [Escallonia herrerae]|uniref:nicotinate-nucleotide diphosphorylase (carboxylating) n=1 Tax=Escallonia herrerae TaxID=1293975 RepID=A0AA88XC79_9ASTE|nr:hypothetical protein RJ639_000592 [Escallonia herrerae]
MFWLSFSALPSPHSITASRHIIKMTATTNKIHGVSTESISVKPPAHPTYDLKAVIKLALAEDAGNRGDITCMATIPADMDVEAYFLAKEDGIIAGIALAEMVFNEVDPALKVEWSKQDGDSVHKGLQFGKVHGRAHNVVVAERVVLNFMQRMSGIATLTKRNERLTGPCFFKAMADAAYPAHILETRKTAPGLRLVDKWAVLIGGGRNHRMGLFDMVMIKDNHISVAGGITNALKSVDTYLEQNKLQMGVEIETRTLKEVNEVLDYASRTKTSLTRIMLDNMVVPLSNGGVDVSMLLEAVKLINGTFETERCIDTFSESSRHLPEDRYRACTPSRKAYKASVASVPFLLLSVDSANDFSATILLVL